METARRYIFDLIENLIKSLFSYAGVAVIDRPKFFLPQRRLYEKNEQFPESDRTEDK